jgi:hypothetical protein
MRTTTSVAHSHGMSTASTARITLELKVGADPIRGLIEQADGNRQPFWGWLELIEELRRIAADQPERTAQPTPTEAQQLPEPDARTERRKRQTLEEERS